MIEHSYLIVLLPLLSALTIFFFGRYLPLKGAVLGICTLGITLIHSLGIFSMLLQNPSYITEISIPWFRFGIHQTEFGFLIDGLTALMLVVVTSVSFLVHVYSLGYMQDDPRFKRYYAYLSFFTFAMLLLVVANNFLQMFIGWELVGLASYLLIGFWFEKTSASNAGRKAFITTKVGDIGFFLGILSLFSLLGTLNFAQVQGRIEEGLISANTAGIIALLLFCGAMGKSAQVPLHIWLPDAMEGPTPVSALIHAATMVAAGVYMVARSYFLFQHGPFSLEIIAWVGMLTAFLAATMALVATDIKRVLAFSTVSQLGYMILSMGVGGRAEGMFHLTTHAFFKALLFLGAGSVIHATHTNNIEEMGGLSKKMKLTFIAFTSAWLAISGIWPFAGFFSKDGILEATLNSGNSFLFWCATFVAFLTAFYMTRLYLLVFIAEPKDKEIYNHAHESPKSMTIPLLVLALLSLVAGFLLEHSVPLLLSSQALPLNAHASSAHTYPHWLVPAISSAAALLGIFLSYLIYWLKAVSAEKIASTFSWPYRLLLKKYNFDEFYIYCIIKPADWLAQKLALFDTHIFDQLGVDGIGFLTVKLSQIQDWFDQNIIDNLVDIWGKLSLLGSSILRKFQTGLVQNYILFILFGFGLLMVWQLKINFIELLR
ncbi:MAG: NADH-quinone oxidoreductase subunit L [Elusimicrobia bacterium]|nr:NADH-quinone oxidoreductase subunit L [Elusimicrobiota bacterium]